MKKYYGFVSFSGRLAFRVEAENEEQAQDIVFTDMEGITIDVPPESPVEAGYIEWDLISQQARGNVSESYIDDFEIYED